MACQQDGENRTNLIINYLPQTMTDKELNSMFITIGPIKSTRIMKDGKTGYSYGFGFVEFHKPEDASRAIATLNGLQVMNKRIKVSYARPPGEDIKDTNLYISNLPRDITSEKLAEWFGKFGTIVQSNILKDKSTGIPRGVAFVRYDKRSEAMRAIEQMNGVIPPDSSDSLQVKIAEEHGKQKAAFYAGWQAGLNQSSQPGNGDARHYYQRDFPPRYGRGIAYDEESPGVQFNRRLGYRGRGYMYATWDNSY